MRARGANKTYRRLLWRALWPHYLGVCFVFLAFLPLYFGIRSTAVIVMGGCLFALWFVMIGVSVFRVTRLEHRRDSNLCLRCGYDQRGNAEPGVCPECGFAANDGEVH